jgi:hypothetical protein
MAYCSGTKVIQYWHHQAALGTDETVEMHIRSILTKLNLPGGRR